MQKRVCALVVASISISISIASTAACITTAPLSTSSIMHVTWRLPDGASCAAAGLDEVTVFVDVADDQLTATVPCERGAALLAVPQGSVTVRVEAYAPDGAARLAAERNVSIGVDDSVVEPPVFELGALDVAELWLVIDHRDACADPRLSRIVIAVDDTQAASLVVPACSERAHVVHTDVAPGAHALSVAGHAEDGEVLFFQEEMVTCDVGAANVVAIDLFALMWPVLSWPQDPLPTP